MMLRKLASFLTSRPPTAATAQPIIAPGTNASQRPKPSPSTPVYPPSDHGVTFYPAHEVLATQADLLHRLRMATGVPDAEYDRLYGSVVTNLANGVNLLPATETGTHQGAGGLFRLSLEMGFYALQASEATIFAARAGVERRRLLEPRWRYATWLAGMCCELYRPITTMIVTTPDGDQWPTYRLPLGEWLDEKGVDRYYIRWIDQSPGKQRPGRGAAATLAHRLIPDIALQYLHEGSNEIVPTMIDVITGSFGSHNPHPMARIIEEVREKVVARDNAIRPQTYGKLTVGQHTEPHLLDAMRRLLKSGKWTVNIKKSRLWLGDEGLFLIWPTAANEMLAMLREDGIAGIPQDSQTILEILAEAQVFEPHHDGGYFWTVFPPSSANELAAVKFANPDTIFGALFDAPESAGVLTKRIDADAVSATTASTAPTEVHAEPTTSPESEPVQQASPDPAEAESGPTVPSRSEPPAAKVSSPSGAVPPPDLMHKSRAEPRRSKEQQPKAEIDLAQKVKPELGNGLDALTRDVFGALLDDLRAGKITNEAGKCKEGYAIGIEHLASYGIDIPTFAAAVQKAGWLYTPADKPNKKLIEVQINGKSQRAIVLKLHVAIDMGFVT